MRRLALLVLSVPLFFVVAGTAAGKAPPDRFTLDPITFTDVNPCTGEEHEVTLVLTVSEHVFELNDPDRHHVNVKVSGTLTTSDGFSGRLTESDVDNGAGLFEAQEGRGMFTGVINGTASNASGDKFRVHAMFHITLVNGEPVALVDTFKLDCLG